MQIIEGQTGQPGTKGTIEVDEWRLDTDRLVTSRVGTPIILAAHNMSGSTDDQRRSTGLLGSFSMIGSTDPKHKGREQFQAALKELKTLGSPSETKIWLGGGAISSTDRPNTSKADRNYALQSVFIYLASNGLSHILPSFEWSPPSNVTAAELDCRTGILTVERTLEPQHFITPE